MQSGRKSRGIPKPPAHLGDVSKAFWRTVTKGWELEPHHVRLLQIACESWDRALEAREAVTASGPYFTDRHGNIKPHPGIAVEQQSRKQFIASLREIGLDVKAPDSPRAPMLPVYRKVG